MPLEQEPERARKKRKLPAGNTIHIGGHAISLDGYFRPAPKPAPKPTLDARKPSPDEEPTENPRGRQLPKNQASAGPAETRRCLDRPPKQEALVKPARKSDPHWKDDPALLKAREKLPIWRYRSEIQEALRTPGRDVLILVGETGSGKSTQVPQFLYRQDWCQRRKVKISTAAPAANIGSNGTTSRGTHEDDVWVGGMVAVTQPRRVAATTLAHRVAAEAGTPLGGGGGHDAEGLVGYSVRFDHRVPRGTRIKYMTEGMLLQELLRDPGLRQYSVVVVDEIHERSTDVDLLVGFLKQIIDGDKRSRGGVPLKVVVMSATADVDAVRQFFESRKPDEPEQQEASRAGGGADRVQLLRIEGRQHPVRVIHTPEPVADVRDALLETVFDIHLHEALPGDILAFLTGREEIEAAQKLIEERAAGLASDVPGLRVFPLYGQLSIEAQHQSFQPVREEFTRKVVLATNIAETSVTVPGVRYVVDCGKVKVKQFRPRLGMESLLAKPVSKSSAVQRTGRAGREAPGKCYRLYTAEGYDALPEADLPEILRSDVLGAVLTMKAHGIHDVLGFPLMSAPDAESVQRALLHLHFLGGLDDRGGITRHGRQMALFPVSAPFARVLVAAAGPEFGCVLEAIDVVSCLTAGEDLFHHHHHDVHASASAEEEARAEEIEALRRELRRREGDLLTYLTTLHHYVAENADRAAWCRRRRIDARSMRQALSIRRQLRVLCLRAGLLAEPPPPDPQPVVPLSPARADVLLRCFVRGFAFRTAVLAPDASYVTVRGKHVVAVHPSSVLHGQKREAILFLEHVFTAKSYAKRVSAIRASWIAEVLEGAWAEPSPAFHRSLAG